MSVICACALRVRSPIYAFPKAWLADQPKENSSGWWFGTFFSFPYIGLLIIPIDVHIFQRGGPTTNQWWSEENVSRSDQPPKPGGCKVRRFPLDDTFLAGEEPQNCPMVLALLLCCPHNNIHVFSNCSWRMLKIYFTVDRATYQIIQPKVQCSRQKPVLSPSIFSKSIQINPMNSHQKDPTVFIPLYSLYIYLYI